MEPVLIIAEAGVNHNGKINLAHEMIDVAKEAGADIIKFQTACPGSCISRFAEKAEYQKNTTRNDESQLDMCKKILLKYEDHIPLIRHCDKVGIRFLSTPFDLESIHFLDTLGCDFWKIPSGEVTDYPYLVEIGKTKKSVILSTGMCEMNEIKAAIDLLKSSGTGEIRLMHCTTEYPAPYEDVNLNAMLTLKKTFGVEVGYSDHTKGIEIPSAAVSLGASIIEKHFTLDRGMEGPDHKASLEPKELKAMVDSIRHIEKALGSYEKKAARSEKKNIDIARKSIVAKRDIKIGEILTEENITTKRPGSGISPMEWPNVLGKKAVMDFKEDEMIRL